MDKFLDFFNTNIIDCNDVSVDELNLDARYQYQCSKTPQVIVALTTVHLLIIAAVTVLLSFSLFVFYQWRASQFSKHLKGLASRRKPPFRASEDTSRGMHRGIVRSLGLACSDEVIPAPPLPPNILPPSTLAVFEKPTPRGLEASLRSSMLEALPILDELALQSRPNRAPPPISPQTPLRTLIPLFASYFGILPSILYSALEGVEEALAKEAVTASATPGRLRFGGGLYSPSQKSSSQQKGSSARQGQEASMPCALEETALDTNLMVQAEYVRIACYSIALACSRYTADVSGMMLGGNARK